MAKSTKEKWEVVIDDVDSWGMYGFCAYLKEMGDEDDLYQDERVVFGCELFAVETCCGFPMLGEFSTELSPSEEAIVTEEHKEAIVKGFTKWLKQSKRDGLKKKGYYMAFLPNNKEYKFASEILKRAGFIPTVALKSNHGRYKNVRWEWFDGKKVNEKAISALPI